MWAPRPRKGCSSVFDFPWPEPEFVIRPARKVDLPALGRLGLSLAQAHHEWDPARFFVPEGGARGYADWLGREARNRRAVVLVARTEGRVAGYAYGRIEPRDWNLLRDKCGVVVDLMVDPYYRRLGAGSRLLKALIEALRTKGAPFVVLQAAAANRSARRFFESSGFRPTLIEMAKTLEPQDPPPRAKKKTGGRTRSRKGA
jgi:ribosomal protein S18 acetylase RimI-like enzyme